MSDDIQGAEGLATGPAARSVMESDPVLETIQKRVLWLATLIVHHANRIRPNNSGIKVGGHQASSASTVTILTELFFDFLRAGDRISVKPHASPVLHAIHYLLGTLDGKYLKTLREFHGLQAYPSRTKDPYPVDFSTGSVGLGSVAPNFAALADRFVSARFGLETPRRRYITVVGDAELDEGSVWEAIAEPALANLDNLIWIVDLNRQSLDRVVPGIRERQLKEMFRAAGWDVIEAKYGRRLQAAFAERGGNRLRSLIDGMPNEEYQRLLRSTAPEIQAALGDAASALPASELPVVISDLGGHDFAVLRDALARADAAISPSVIFAYTIKGWGLPIAGDPLNHSALLSAAQIDELRLGLGIEAGRDWDRFDSASAEAQLCSDRACALVSAPMESPATLKIPAGLNREYASPISTQGALGRVMTNLAREYPEVARRLVTVSPDVATSTNLGGWINAVGVWEKTDKPDPFTDLGPRLIGWNRSPKGQHIELGISETNLAMALGQFGLTADMLGEPILALGTLYDPFIARCLDALTYCIYSGSRFVLIGTPSGVTLAPEGGAHQSIITTLVGLGMPGLEYFEPCFALELEWILLDAMHRVVSRGKPGSTYLRLSTAAVDQSLLVTENEISSRDKVLSGAYRVVERSREAGCRPDHNLVEIWATGVMVPEAIKASDELRMDGVYADVINCVSPSRIYRRWQGAVHSSLGTLRGLPERSGTPIVTVLDGHPSTLSWIGAMLGVRCVPLGVTDFGESGLPTDLYQRFQIDWESICAAAYVALGGVNDDRR